MVIAPLLLLLALATHPTSRPGGEITPPAHREAPGRRVALAHGELYIPEYYTSASPPNLVIFFLSPAWLAEQNFHDAQRNALLFTAAPATVKAGFPTPESFDAILAEVQSAAPNPQSQWRITLVSFSGGYTAIRDILAQESTASLISNVLLLDSLYAPHVPAGSDHLDPAAMEPFLKFACRAADGKATFIFSQLYPPEEKYRNNTTTLAANYLIDHLHVPRDVHPTTNPSVARPLLYRADLSNFHILGFAGMTNQDHFNHLYLCADLLRLLPIAGGDGKP
ncbi:MAG TPA: hypothetical protein VFE58_12005 [Tepidisphaeraceae bacterium]|jgi:hypothetical protein|nr:hypothetical protein [Tepidisphaeraceae bacterium]